MGTLHGLRERLDELTRRSFWRNLHDVYAKATAAEAELERIHKEARSRWICDETRQSLMQCAALVEPELAAFGEAATAAIRQVQGIRREVWEIDPEAAALIPALVEREDTAAIDPGGAAEALRIIAGKLEKALRERDETAAAKPAKRRRRPGMTQGEADDAVAKLLQQKPPGGGRWSVTSLKKQIDRQGEKTITRERIIAAPAYVRYKATKPAKSKQAVTFSAALEATAASNEPSPLDMLIAEQEADYEPSPVTTRGKRPKAFKRL